MADCDWWMPYICFLATIPREPGSAVRMYPLTVFDAFLLVDVQCDLCSHRCWALELGSLAPHCYLGDCPLLSLINC